MQAKLKKKEKRTTPPRKKVAKLTPEVRSQKSRTSPASGPKKRTSPARLDASLPLKVQEETLRRSGAKKNIPDENKPREQSVLAVIDIGSQSLRMAIAEVGSEHNVHQLETFNVPVAIGLDTFSLGVIRSLTTEAVVKTIGDFLQALRSYHLGPNQCRAVATSAVREARNRDVFLDRIEQTCGLHVEIIEAIEEMRLTYQYVQHSFSSRVEHGTCMILALGGSGTQIIVQRRGEILFGETRHFGMIHLWGQQSAERMAIRVARRFLIKEVRSIQRMQDLQEITTLVVINKELSLLLEQMANVDNSEFGLELPRKELLRLHAIMDKLSTDDYLSGTNLDYPTVEMARMALEELKIFNDFTSANTIWIPRASMLDCLLFDAQLRLEGGQGEDLRVRQIESAAMAIGRRYNFDEAHARQVRLLALQIFDALVFLTHLPSRSKLLLSIAALLHDIGKYVSPHRHQHHSSYLVSASEIIGLGHQDLEKIALLVKFHRHTFTALDHQELKRFSANERVEVLKLAALLRLADALDDDYQQCIEGVQIEANPEQLQFLAITRAGDREGFSLIKRTFGIKADLFSDLFGIEPSLTEVLVR